MDMYFIVADLEFPAGTMDGWLAAPAASDNRSLVDVLKDAEGDVQVRLADDSFSLRTFLIDGAYYEVEADFAAAFARAEALGATGGWYSGDHVSGTFQRLGAPPLPAEVGSLPDDADAWIMEAGELSVAGETTPLASTKKAVAAKKPATKTPAKKAARAKRAVTKKPATKKAAPAKRPAAKAAAKKAAAKKATPAKRPAAKAPTKKTARAKSSVIKKPATKKAAPAKRPADKTAAKKAARAKRSVKKPATKKASPAKKSSSKTAPKKPARAKAPANQKGARPDKGSRRK